MLTLLVHQLVRDRRIPRRGLQKGSRLPCGPLGADG